MRIAPNDSITIIPVLLANQSLELYPEWSSLSIQELLDELKDAKINVLINNREFEAPITTNRAKVDSVATYPL